MKRLGKLKAILASILVTAALVGPTVVLSAVDPDYNAELLISGASLTVMPDGSVQAIFNVGVNKVENGTGAQLTLQYNKEYMEPSYISGEPGHEQNEVITTSGTGEEDGLFAYNSALYPTNPFVERGLSHATASQYYYSTVDTRLSRINLQLWLDQTELAKAENGEKGAIKALTGWGEDRDKKYYVYNYNADAPTASGQGGEVVLGQVSFRVKKDKLPEVLRLFQMPDWTDNAVVSNDSGKATYLLRADAGTRWSVGAYDRGPSGQSQNVVESFYRPDPNELVYGKTEDLYRFTFDGKTPVSARLANPVLSINAYQGYSHGDDGDIALALGRYSPMVTVTYADGTMENFVVPWGQDGTGYSYDNAQIITLDDGTITRTWLRSTPYDPTGGHYYAEQYIRVRGAWFPVPVQADLTVTPINLLNVTASDLERSYPVSTVAQNIHAGSDLGLPTEARLITDVVPGGVSMVMTIPGWTPTQTGSAWPKLEDPWTADTMMNSLRADSYNDEQKIPYWPDGKDQKNGWPTSEPEKFVGTYTFTMADGYGGTPTGFTKEAIQGVYPWLTVEKSQYPVDDSGTYDPLVGHRHIVGGDAFTDYKQYEALYVSTETNATNQEPTVTLGVKRADGKAMSENSQFRVWLPNGLELGTGLQSKDIMTAGKDFTVDDWFPASADLSNGDYEVNTQGSASDRHYHLVTNTGHTDAGTFQSEREVLRRYVNLGGWFTISVCEDVEQKTWSEPMPVYVPPRTNLYTQTKEYNFLGENAGLLKHSRFAGTKVTLPRGSYTVVNSLGEPLYEGSGRRWESYGLTTLYDGQTGAQPGELFNFTVDNSDNSWDQRAGGFTSPVAGGRPFYVYGPSSFRSGELYEGFGKVYQPGAPMADETGTLRVEEVMDEHQIEKITLTSLEPRGITREVQGDLGSNVTLATYDTQTVGYQSRQDYLFTITNVGDTDIYGLGIDGLTDGYPDDKPGGRFEMLQAPADFLAPGQSTTFILTYIYDLDPNGAPGTPDVYRDTLYITSDNHPDPGNIYGDGSDRDNGDYLLDFDAQFTVSDSLIHDVDIIVLPETADDSKTGNDKLPVTYPMGTADVIIGEQPTGGTPVMDYTTATRSYPKDRTVYIVVEPKDEYDLVTPILAVDSASGNVPVIEYGRDKDGNQVANVAELEDGKLVYWFTMPDYDVTVTVRFVEKTFSKLRLSNIVDYSAGPNLDQNGKPIDQTKDFNVKGTADKELKPAVATVADENTYKVWRKRFTDEEIAKAEALGNDGFNTGPDLYLMTMGTAVPATEDPPGDKFNPSENQYLVVIPYDADRSQIEATLREIAVEVDGNGNKNEDIKPTVTMALFGTHFTDKTAANDANKGDDESMDYTGDPEANSRQIYSSLTDATLTGGVGDTDGPTVHTSEVFDSPLPGSSKYVRIAVSLKEGSETTYRYYYVELHRAPKDAVAQLNYGNSPYGMIMNDTDKFTSDESRAAAKESFLAGYTFRGLGGASVPTAAQDGKMDRVVYWREAWVKNTRLYEPESGTGRTWTELFEDETDPTKVTGRTWVDNDDVYEAGENLDLNDYAYFAILGEAMREPGLAWALDSSGRKVDLTKVAVSARVTLLDTDGATQVARFSGQDAKTLDLGSLDATGKGKMLSVIPAGSTDPITNGNWPVEAVPGTNDQGEAVTNYVQVGNIRPGRYALTYTYTDFDGVSTLAVTRPFVILSPVGDVNADLTRDTGYVAQAAPAAGYQATDEYVLENRVADPLGWEAGTAPTVTEPAGGVYPYANIFRFRVCDVNNDRNINNIDGNLIDQNVKAGAADSQDHFLRFYHPTEYGLK